VLDDVDDFFWTMSDGRRNLSAPHGAVPTTDDTGEIQKYLQVAKYRVRFGLWRGLALVVLIYVVNVMFNALEVLVRSGISSLSTKAAMRDVLLIDALATVNRQVPSLVGSFTGFVLVAIALAVTARWRHARRMRDVRRQLVAFRTDQLKRRLERHGETRFNQADVDRWVDDDIRNDTTQRSEKLDQIKQWFEYDELLVEWTALEISARRFKRDIGLSVLAAVIAVIIARLALLLG
jgi:hypothetical protein